MEVFSFPEIWGLTGKRLSQAIAKAGYDGIVTVKKKDGQPIDTSEIVDLRMFHNNDAKPMALPIRPSREEVYQKLDFEPGGIKRIDDVMTEETARQEYSPGMEWESAGSLGVVYRDNGEIIKYTKDPNEAQMVQYIFSLQQEGKLDWVVPFLGSPELTQSHPPIYKIRMKELQPLEGSITRLISNLTYLRKTVTVEIDRIMDLYDQEINVDMIQYIYNRVKYVLDENEKTLELSDLHGGNWGWDDNEIKVWDVGPVVSYNVPDKPSFGPEEFFPSDEYFNGLPE